jgi:tRNA (cytidine/uridine-2'-O-)-methyltransferase
MPRIALYQPDIPHNTGAILRFAACMGVEVDIIEPAGFDLSDRGLKRAGMDYVERAALKRHASFETFEAWRAGAGGRLVLFSTMATVMARLIAARAPACRKPCISGPRRD